MSTEPRLTLDQQRAKSALARVQRHRKNSWAKEYRSYVRSLPLLITLIGLGQTIALELSGSGGGGNIGKGHAALLSDILSWIGSSSGWQATPYDVGFADGEDLAGKALDLLSRLTTQDEHEMIRAQAELVAYVRWLKTLAEAMIDPRDDDGVEPVDA